MDKLDDDIDALFQLPLAEFTAARNAFASRLKKAGNPADAERVRQMGKPPVSAWAVNQLYWKHSDVFKTLLAAGERFGRAHMQQASGKTADLHGPLAEKREALTGLARLAAALLTDAGHTPTPETMRRITTTLEALATYALFPNAPNAGRLTGDLDPPGLEELAALIPAVARVDSAARAEKPIETVDRQAAEQRLRKLQAMVKDAEAALKAATEHANETERIRRDTEERFRKAASAAEAARERLQNAEAQAEKARKLLNEEERRHAG